MLNKLISSFYDHVDNIRWGHSIVTLYELFSFKNSPIKITSCVVNIFVTTLVKLLILGFGLLESGSVTTKNEVNIMVKNAADVIFGGLSYWAFGYALSFGEGK